MNRKVILARVLSVLLMAFMITTTLCNSVFAAKTSLGSESSTSLNVDQFDKVEFEDAASGSVQKIIASIISVTQIIGIGVAIIMLIVLAIKYISAAPSEKAEIKKTVTIYVVGAVVLFAASGILEIIKKFATNVSAD